MIIDVITEDNEVTYTPNLPNPFTENVRNRLFWQGIRKCIMVDDISGTNITPRYDGDARENVCVDEHHQLSTLLEAENIIPIFHVCAPIDPEYSSKDVANSINDTEAGLFFHAIRIFKNSQARESKYPFGTPKFFNDGFKQVEQYDLCVHHVALNPKDKEEVLELCKDAIDENQIWTANMVYSEHVPEGTAFFMPSPDEVGVMPIIEDWHPNNKFSWIAKMGLFIQAGWIAWEKGRDPNWKEEDAVRIMYHLDIIGEEQYALLVNFAQEKHLMVDEVTIIRNQKYPTFLLQADGTDLLVYIKDNTVYQFPHEDEVTENDN